MTHLVEIRAPDGVRQVRVDGRVELGREFGDIVVADPTISRRHVLLDGTGPTLIVTDLGSSNGTYLDGIRLEGPAELAPGSELRLGDTTIQVLQASQESPVDPATDAPPATLAAGQEGAIHTEAVEVRFVPGTYGASLARPFAALAGRARSHLGGLGSEPWGTVPVLHLIDPYHDGTEIVASGTMVDTASGHAWFVVTPEAPPEDPHRVLALLFGAVLPAAPELAGLLEGYGLHRSGLPDPDADLRGADLPELADAAGELRAPMLLSFVRYLVGRGDEDRFRRLLAAPAGRVDATAEELLGAQIPQLERDWREALAADEPRASTGQFLRLSLAALRPYRLKQAEIFVYMLLSLAFVAAFPFVTRRLFDTAIPSGRFSEVFTLLLVLGAAFVVSLLAAVRQAYQTAWVTGAVTRDLRRNIFAKIQRLPTPWYASHSQGDVLARLFGDVEQVQIGLSEAIGQGVYQTLSLMVSAAIMLTIDLRLGLLVLVIAPLVGVVYRRMAAQAQARSLAVQENTAGLLSVAAENYRAIPVIKLFGLAPREERRFGDRAEDVFTAERQLSLWTGFFGLSVNLIVTVLRLAVLGLGAYLILEDKLTVGGLVAFLAVMGDVLAPVTVLVTLSQDVQASLGSLVRINEILDARPEPERDDLPRLAPVQRTLELRDVSFAYTADRRALDDFSVSIPAGTKVAFVGPSGSGKSTVLRLLMRLYDPDEGVVTVDGVDMRSCSLSSWRDQIGVVFQDSFLFDVSVWENIALGGHGATTEEVQAAARAAEVDSFIAALADGWNTVVGEGGANLSGGQRQRVAIARALLRNPGVLLLDEATSALDAATERQINETIDRIAAGRTIVAVTHRLASISRFDQICVVVDGRLAEQGTHAELLARGGTYAQLWAEQTGLTPTTPSPLDARAALRRVPFLSGVSEAVLDELVASLEPMLLATGDQLEDGSGLLLVAAGRAEVLVSDSAGRPSAVAELRPGDAFGIAASLGATSTSFMRALEPTRVLLLSRAHVERLSPPAATLAPAPLLDAERSVRLSRMTLGGTRRPEHPQDGEPTTPARPTGGLRSSGIHPHTF